MIQFLRWLLMVESWRWQFTPLPTANLSIEMRWATRRLGRDGVRRPTAEELEWIET